MPDRFHRGSDGFLHARTQVGEREQLARNEVGKLTIQTRAPLVVDNHDRIPSLGRFVISG